MVLGSAGIDLEETAVNKAEKAPELTEGLGCLPVTLGRSLPLSGHPNWHAYSAYPSGLPSLHVWYLLGTAEGLGGISQAFRCVCLGAVDDAEKVCVSPPTPWVLLLLVFPFSALLPLPPGSLL